MAARTETHSQHQLFIPFGGVEFAKEAYSAPVVNIVLRAGPHTHSTGLHWHETHTEYLQVLQGHALVTIGSRTSVFGKDDGVITIPRGTIHQYMRADKTEEGSESRDVDLIVREWTEPADGDKEVFFRNMMSLLMDKKDTAAGGISLLLSIMVVAWAHDNYPVFWQGPSFLGEAFQSKVRMGTTYCLMGALNLVGRLLGYKRDYPEYTPERPVPASYDDRNF
jgi:mannose-6-phosphate isomerase-like protein (cupin superfamily)